MNSLISKMVDSFLDYLSKNNRIKFTNSSTASSSDSTKDFSDLISRIENLGGTAAAEALGEEVIVITFKENLSLNALR